jgi:hypothetical protein
MSQLKVDLAVLLANPLSCIYKHWILNQHIQFHPRTPAFLQHIALKTTLIMSSLLQIAHEWKFLYGLNLIKAKSKHPHSFRISHTFAFKLYLHE